SGPEAPLLIFAIALDAIPRAQGHSLVGAAQRVEGLSRDAGSVLGPAMVRAENLFVGTERGVGGAPCFSRGGRGDQQPGQMATHAICVGMLGAARLLADRQRALEQRPRRRQVALALQ